MFTATWASQWPDTWAKSHLGSQLPPSHFDLPVGCLGVPAGAPELWSCVDVILVTLGIYSLFWNLGTWGQGFCFSF